MVQHIFTTAGAVFTQHNLCDDLAKAILSGAEVQIYSDYDGTLFPFVLNPDDVKIDPACHAAIKELPTFENVSIMGLTGRDVHRAHEMVEGLEMDIIGSHGVEVLKADGTLIKYEFSESDAQHIANFQNTAAELLSQFEGINVELDKHGSVGINVASVPDEQRQVAYDQALQILKNFENDTFKIALEGVNEMELRPHNFGKDFGIKAFGNPNKEAVTFFFCDSLGPHGTDRVAAELINDKSQFPNGRVGMVLTGRLPVPAVHEKSAPAYVFPSPADLGQALMGAVQIVQKNLSMKAVYSADIAPISP